MKEKARVGDLIVDANLGEVYRVDYVGADVSIMTRMRDFHEVVSTASFGWPYAIYREVHREEA